MSEDELKELEELRKDVLRSPTGGSYGPVKRIVAALPTLIRELRAARAEIAAKDAEIARLRDIVGKLPTTADGAPIVPEMEVWTKEVKSRRGLKVLSVYSDSVTVGHDLDDEIDPYPMSFECFAARSAALAASGKGQAAESETR